MESPDQYRRGGKVNKVKRKGVNVNQTVTVNIQKGKRNKTATNVSSKPTGLENIANLLKLQIQQQMNKSLSMPQGILGSHIMANYMAPNGLQAPIQIPNAPIQHAHLVHSNHSSSSSLPVYRYEQPDKSLLFDRFFRPDITIRYDTDSIGSNESLTEAERNYTQNLNGTTLSTIQRDPAVFNQLNTSSFPTDYNMFNVGVNHEDTTNQYKVNSEYFKTNQSRLQVPFINGSHIGSSLVLNNLPATLYHELDKSLPYQLVPYQPKQATIIYSNSERSLPALNQRHEDHPNFERATRQIKQRKKTDEDKLFEQDQKDEKRLERIDQRQRNQDQSIFNRVQKKFNKKQGLFKK
jgi:hypothetical protein